MNANSDGSAPEDQSAHEETCTPDNLAIAVECILFALAIIALALAAMSFSG